MKVLHVEGGRNLYGGAHQVLLLIEGLKAAKVALDRKVLAAIAADPTGFKAIADKVRAALA